MKSINNRIHFTNTDIHNRNKSLVSKIAKRLSQGVSVKSSAVSFYVRNKSNKIINCYSALFGIFCAISGPVAYDPKKSVLIIIISYLFLYSDSGFRPVLNI